MLQNLIVIGFLDFLIMHCFFKVVERRKQIEIEEQEIKRKEKELIATVRFAAFGKCQNFGENRCVLNKIAIVVLQIRVLK